MAFQINQRLADPTFYETLWPYVTSDKDGPETSLGVKSDPTELRREFHAAFARSLKTSRGSKPNTTANADEAFARWQSNLCQIAAEASALQARVQGNANEPRPTKTPVGIFGVIVAWLDGYANVLRPRSDYVALPRDGEVPQTGDLAVADEKERAIVEVNRRLLRAYYGDHIEPVSIVFSTNVLHADQTARLNWLLWSGVIFLVAVLIVDLNATSLHGFYSAQVGKAWVEPQTSFGHDIPLAQLNTTSRGRPYHLINGTVQLMDLRRGESALRQQAFLFSQEYCGCDMLSYAPTWQYMGGLYELDDAVAVSGAAVSPTLSKNPLILTLLLLSNMRLGQWVDNPAYKRTQRLDALAAVFAWPITPIRVAYNLFRAPQQRRMCFVTDGGHYENLGIEALLLRRCKVIIALDAGQDGDYAFVDFANLVRRMRMLHGIRLQAWGTAERAPSAASNQRQDAQTPAPLRLDEITPRGLCPRAGAAGAADIQAAEELNAAEAPKSPRPLESAAALFERRLAKKHFVVLRIEYPKTDKEPGGAYGCLVYAKSTLTGDEPFDLTEFAKSQTAFPHDETADQFYESDRFESYRQLGFHIGQHVANFFKAPPKAGEPAIRAEDLTEWPSPETRPEMPSDQELASAETSPPDAPDVARELKEIEALIKSGKSDEAFERIAIVFERGPQALAHLPELLRIIAIKTFRHDAAAPLHEYLDEYPKNAAEALRGILQKRNVYNDRIHIEAISQIECLVDAPGADLAYIVAALVEQIDVDASERVIVRAFSALKKLAADDANAIAQAKRLIEIDGRQSVVKKARWFLN